MAGAVVVVALSLALRQAAVVVAAQLALVQWEQHQAAFLAGQPCMARRQGHNRIHLEAKAASGRLAHLVLIIIALSSAAAAVAGVNRPEALIVLALAVHFLGAVVVDQAVIITLLLLSSEEAVAALKQLHRRHRRIKG
jgi:hypothetical protein